MCRVWLSHQSCITACLRARGRSLEALEAEHKAKLAQGVMEQGPSQAQMDRAVWLLKAAAACQNTLTACVNPLLWLCGYQGYAYVQPGATPSVSRS